MSKEIPEERVRSGDWLCGLFVIRKLGDAEGVRSGTVYRIMPEYKGHKYLVFSRCENAVLGWIENGLAVFGCDGAGLVADWTDLLGLEEEMTDEDAMERLFFEKVVKPHNDKPSGRSETN